MTIRIHNTLTGMQDELVPGGVLKDDPAGYPPVTIYSCGPTVYSYAHIGNFRTFIFNDFLRRYLKFRGFRVNHAMNITDVDDKTIAGARAGGESLAAYTKRYTDIFLDNCRTLNLEPVEHLPTATGSIDAMDEIITRLDEKGLVYEKEGSLYFSIAKFERYGRLSRLDTREIKTGLRYDTDEYDKDDVRDFALWKASAPDEDAWDITLGRGRPGWHIECSAMVRKIFGTTIDIHTGGVDLIFPHHENEIAQSEAAYGEPFVRHWIHAEHLLVDNAKMSKSKGNFYTLKDLLDRGYSPRAIRYLLMSAHYRKQLNFTLAGLEAVSAPLERIDSLAARLGELAGTGGGDPELDSLVSGFYGRFTETVDDDLNISGGLGVFFDFVHGVNARMAEGKLSAADGKRLLEVLKDIDRVFGFIFFPENDADAAGAERIDALVAERNAAKKDKNFARADEIRDQLIAEGIIIEDTKDGTRWRKKQ